MAMEFENLHPFKTAEIQFNEVSLKPSEIHKMRGYFGNRFKEFSALHNHDPETGKSIYRYPAVQFKLLNRRPMLTGYKEEGIEILKQLFLDTGEIVIDDRVLLVREKEMDLKEQWMGEDGQLHEYRFMHPWIALNQKNYKTYRNLKIVQDKEKKLQGIIINNILSFCKFAQYRVKEKLMVKVKLHEVRVKLKGELLTGFSGEFTVNILLPDYIGLGKSTSRGYGMIKRL